MGKSNLCVRLDGDKLKQFKDYVFNKYGKLYGVMSLEVQQALVNWMSQQGLAPHTNTHINPGMPRAQQKVDQIIASIREVEGYSNQVTTRALESAITRICGADDRTIKKYKMLAVKFGRIKFYAGNVWEIV
jgi:hypothetical protein